MTVFGDGELTRDLVNAGGVFQANLKAAAAGGVTGAFIIGSRTGISGLGEGLPEYFRWAESGVGS